MNYRAAMVCCLIAEVNRDRKRHAKAYTPDDFMPRRRERMPDKQIQRVLGHINKMLGGKEV